MTKRVLATSVASMLALGAAACGSSKAPGVQLAPSGGATQAAVPTTPKPPPAIATKPVVAVPTAAPPQALVPKALLPGTGQAAQPGQTVTVNYVGVLYKTGTEFDSSW